jgi:DNA-binding Lrp family transcriptional regulator
MFHNTTKCKNGDNLMTKTSKENIKKDEKRIIECIMKNSNESVNAIANRCGFSRQKVWRILNRLEKNHTIWGYTAVVDGEKIGQRNYIILIKRTTLPITDKMLENVIGRGLDESAEKLDIHLKSSIYLNGIFDWIICFTAEDTKQAKKLVEMLNITYKGHVSEIYLLESMFHAKNNGILNPNIDDLRDFFSGL